MWIGQKIKDAAGTVKNVTSNLLQEKQTDSDKKQDANTPIQTKQQDVNLLDIEDQITSEMTITELINRFQQNEMINLSQQFQNWNSFNDQVILMKNKIISLKNEYRTQVDKFEQDLWDHASIVERQKLEFIVKVLDQIPIQFEFQPSLTWTQFNDRLNKLGSDIKQLSQIKYAPLVKDNKKLKQQISQLNNNDQKIQELNKQIENIKQEKDYFKKQQIQLQMEYNQLEEQFQNQITYLKQQIQSQNEVFSAEKATLNKDIDEYILQINSLQDEQKKILKLKIIQQQIKELKDNQFTVFDLESQINKFKQTIFVKMEQFLNNQQQDLESEQLSIIEEEITDQDQKVVKHLIRSYNRKQSEHVDNLIQTDSELIPKLIKFILHLEKEIDVLREQPTWEQNNVEIQDSNQIIILELQQQLNKKTGEICILQAEITDLNIVRENLGMQIEDLQCRYLQSQEIFNSLQGKIENISQVQNDIVENESSKNEFEKSSDHQKEFQEENNHQNFEDSLQTETPQNNEFEVKNGSEHPLDDVTEEKKEIIQEQNTQEATQLSNGMDDSIQKTISNDHQIEAEKQENTTNDITTNNINDGQNDQCENNLNQNTEQSEQSQIFNQEQEEISQQNTLIAKQTLQNSQNENIDFIQKNDTSVQTFQIISDQYVQAAVDNYEQDVQTINEQINQQTQTQNQIISLDEKEEKSNINCIDEQIQVNVQIDNNENQTQTECLQIEAKECFTQISIEQTNQIIQTHSENQQQEQQQQQQQQQSETKDNCTQYLVEQTNQDIKTQLQDQQIDTQDNFTQSLVDQVHQNIQTQLQDQQLENQDNCTQVQIESAHQDSQTKQETDDKESQSGIEILHQITQTQDEIINSQIDTKVEEHEILIQENQKTLEAYENLVEENNSLKLKLEQYQILQEQLQLKEESYILLQEEYHTVNNNNDELQQQLQEKRKQLDSLQQEINNNEICVIELKNQISSQELKLKEQLNEIQGQLEKEEQENEHNVKLIVELEGQAQKSEFERSEIEKQLILLKEEVQHVEQNYIEKNEQYIKLYEETNQMNDQLKLKNQQLQEIRIQEEQLQALITESLYTLLNEKIIIDFSQIEKQKQKINENIIQQKDSYKKEIDNLTQQIKQQQKQNSDQKQQLSDLQQKLIISNSEYLKKEQQINQELQLKEVKLNEQIDKSNQIYNQLQKSEQKKKDQEKQLVEIEKQKRDLQEEIKNKNLEIENGKQLINKKQVEITGLQQQLQNSVQDTIKLAEQSKLIVGKNCEIQQLNKKISIYEETIEQLNQSVINFQFVNESLQQKFDLKQSDYEQLVKELKEQINKLNNQIKEKVEDENVQNAINDLQLKIRKKEETIVLLQSEKEQILENCNKKIQQISQNQQNYIDKRVIKEALLNYFDNRAPQKIRQSILHQLCCILSMTEQEAAKIGVQIQKLNLQEIQQKQEQQQQSLKDNFINYLLSD